MKPFCAAIDWGTSTFRLWLLDEDGGVIAGRRTDQGLLQANALGFEKIVDQHLTSLGSELGNQWRIESDLPIVVCGMAGSRQGWCEAGYLNTPVELPGLIENSVRVVDSQREIRILPGIAQRDPKIPDVIRGEETQLLGVLDHIGRDGYVCMPGTHSKWIKFHDAKLEHFSTFMSGELFGLLANHSILKLGLDEHGTVSPDSPDFLDAFKRSSQNGAEISNHLFMARSSYLLGYSTRRSNAAFLSGSVIGVEVAGVQSKYGQMREVTLIASGQLRELYYSALSSIGMIVHSLDADEAVRGGLFQTARAFWRMDDERKSREA